RLPLKRKTPPTDNDASESNTPPPSFPAPPSEYETGRIDCPSCHKQVAFRDEETGKLSIKRWQQHWESCRSPPTRSVQQRSIHNLVSSHMDNYQPESDDPRFPSMMSHPPTKRRRAKRTEEERIAYLRADPYVAKFEAYRVLCASCDKWIRLRPNSTYCSIPWDAHRKSCLSKKISNKNTYALDERNSLFTKDPDVRKFDAERVLCAVCDHWIPINSEDHLQAVQTWLNHRGDCAKRAAAAAGVSHHGPTPSTGSGGSPPQHVLLVDLSHPPSGQSPVAANNTNGKSFQPSNAHSTRIHPSDPSTPSGIDAGPQSETIMYSPAAGIFPPGPANESRRRNAEQRAATLRADTLIKHVEPNRVFCSLCEKWVQLRQDSSFCAYPWFQHRGKCLARYQRRAQKAAEIEDIKKRRAMGGGSSVRTVYAHDPQRHSDDEDGMNTRFDYRGLSASASPASEGRSVSVASMASVGKQGLSTSQPQGESSASTSGARPPNQAQLTNMHRPIAPRDAPHVIQPPRSRTDVHHQNRPADPGHSLIPVHPQHGKPYHHHHGAINGGPGPYRYSQHPREQTYTDPRPRSDSAHAYAYEGGRIYREKSHRVHRGPSQVRSHGPYGNGALPSSYPSDLSPQNGNGRGVLADLDSPAGRKQFVSHSIAYLFQTTYDCSPCSSDELSISALVAYLNAAMPMDKHEDFDTAEVVKCVGALREKGKVLLEGDVVRKVRKSRE
ncbi:hypothetical protein FB446DRAFT_650777, partial [Lentinula raphanica]